MSTEGQRTFLGYLYVARKKCGKVVGASWAAPGLEEENAALIARWVNHGFSVEKIDCYEGDLQPQWICGSNEPCACRDAEKSAK